MDSLLYSFCYVFAFGIVCSVFYDLLSVAICFKSLCLNHVNAFAGCHFAGTAVQTSTPSETTVTHRVNILVASEASYHNLPKTSWSRNSSPQGAVRLVHAAGCARSDALKQGYSKSPLAQMHMLKCSSRCPHPHTECWKCRCMQKIKVCWVRSESNSTKNLHINEKKHFWRTHSRLQLQDSFNLPYFKITVHAKVNFGKSTCTYAHTRVSKDLRSKEVCAQGLF